MELSGVLLPATTPFDPVTGDVDLVAMRRNVRTWLRAPLSGVVLFGSTGEGPLLELDERTRLLEAVRPLVGGGRLLLAGTGEESTRATLRATRAAAEAGADAVLVRPPAYYGAALTPAALREHFRTVADGSPVPVVLYRVPPRFAGPALEPGLVAELARHPNVAGVKDSSGDLRTVAALAEGCAGRCAVLAGSGAILFGALEAGAAGGIVAAAALMPDECAAIQQLRSEGKMVEAGRLQERIAPLHRAVVVKLAAPGIKAALDRVGMAGGPPRPPLRPPGRRDLARVDAALRAAGLLGADDAPQDAASPG